MRAARALRRAPVFRCRAPFWTALSIREMSASYASSTLDPSPSATASRSLRKCVLTELTKRRFSVRSRSVRSLRFFCDAMFAMCPCPRRPKMLVVRAA